MHPLANDISGLSADDLEKKRAQLNDNLFRAYRHGDHNLVHQVQLLLDDYNQEIDRRHRELLEKTSKDGKSFADKINVGK